VARSRRGPLLLIVVAALVATGLATTLTHPKNPSVLPSGLAVSINAESTALYCTGLSNVGPRPGRVTFYNTAGNPRHLTISIVSDRGSTWSGSIELASHGAQSVEPSVLDKSAASAKATPPTSYGVAVQISGGGVVAEEIGYNSRAEVPCVSQGVTHWSATGFSTLVGSSAYLSVFNPSATSAVFNVAVFTASGVSDPESYQGLAVPAHAQREVNLDTEVVNTPNVGVRLSVQRGSLEVVGVEDSNGTLSYEQGLASGAEDVWFPTVTTVNKATAEISVMNPSGSAANVTVNVKLGSYKIAPQTLTVLPYSTGALTITPNSAIPDDGYANLTLKSNQPVITALATGASSSIALSSPVTPDNAFLVHDFTGLGFDAVTMTNTSSRTITIDISSFNTKTPNVITGVGGIKLAPGVTENLISKLFPTPTGGSSHTYLVMATKPSLIVSLTLPSTPRGVNLVAPLDGR
jgi:Family of unknown function (DUF5719)